jgi:hypothetical protein
VRDRAAQQQADVEDEIQDAVLAAYDAGAGAWDEAAGVAERQAAVAAATDALERAVATGRAARAAGLSTVGSQQQQDDRERGANLFDPAVLTVAAGRVRAAFGPGVRLWAALVAEVVAGRVQPGTQGLARGALGDAGRLRRRRRAGRPRGHRQRDRPRRRRPGPASRRSVP